MRSNIVTCHVGSGDFSSHYPKMVLDLATPEGCTAELICVVVISQDSLPAKYPTLNYIRNNRAVSWLGIESTTKSRESNVLTTRPASYLKVGRYLFRCTVASVQKRHVAIARLRQPAVLGRTCQEVWFIILVVTSTKEVHCSLVKLRISTSQVAKWWAPVRKGMGELVYVCLLQQSV